MALIKIPKEMGSTPGIVDNSNATAITIDSSENVGIGRTSITQPSSGATTLAIQGTDTTKGGAIQLYSSDDSVAAYIYPDNSNGLSINTSTSHPIVFRTNATERMRIDASGRVGIGVVPEAWTYFSPIQAKRSSFAGSDGQTGVGYNWYFDGAYKYIENGPALAYQQNASLGVHSWSTAASGTAAASISWSERMRIDASGHVGIGKTPLGNNLSPTLEMVSGGTIFGYGDAMYFTGNLYYNGGWKAIATGAGSSMVLDNGGPKFYTNASASAGATVTPTERMRIDSSGNVGIGNFSAAGKLEVYANNTAPAAYIRQDGTGPIQSWHVAAGAEKMRLTSAGKVVVDGTVAGYSGTQITVGSPSIVTSGLSVLSTTTGHGYLMFGDATGDAAAGYVGQIHYDHSNNSMDIVTNGVQACEWDSDGLQISHQVLANGRRRGMYGIYSPLKIAHIWGMGTDYKVATDGSTGGNLYGLCYSYEPDYGTTGNNPGARSGLGHQMQWRANGGTHTAIGNGIYTVGSVTANSDARLKTDIETIPNAMSKVSALTGITYKRTDLSEPDPATGNQYDVRHTGILAQDLLAVLPEAVEGAINGQQPEDGSYLSVAYGNMAGLFVEALKEQQATIEALTQRIETLENN